MRQSSLLIMLITVLVFSCMHQEKQEVTQAGEKQPGTGLSPDTTINSPVIQQLQYNDWHAYWPAFKKAVSQKDTSGIIGLTFFPFSQNTMTCTKNDFMNSFMEQVFDIDQAPLPVYIDEAMISRIIDDSSLRKRIDSLHITIYRNKEVYFGKIDSAYKLVAIITPG